MTNNQILSLAKELISIPSISGNEKALNKTIGLVKSLLNEYKYKEFESKGIKSILFFNTDKTTNQFKIILNVHLDVVPAEDHMFKPTIKGNKLIGRGTYDMKAAASVMILTFMELAKKIKYPIALQIVTDEETGGKYGTKYQIEKGVRAEFVIAGENSDLEINNESKGVIWVKFKSIGKTAHAAYPWLGSNPVLHMLDILKKLYALYPTPPREEWITTMTPTVINTAGNAVNKIHDVCEVFIDIRYIPQDKNTILKRLKAIFSHNFDIVLNEPEHLTSSRNKYIKLLQKSIYKTFGKNAKTVKKHGSSDIRFYNNVGIEGITFGPKGSGHHSDFEWVDIESLYLYKKILTNFLSSF